ncbi:hypothetical protein B1400_0886, partial [Bifidobacterium italicum]
MTDDGVTACAPRRALGLGRRGLMARWADGESGRRDLRMLPAALCLWAATLAMRAVLSEEGVAGMRGLAVTTGMGACAVMFVTLHGVRMWLRHVGAGRARPALRCASCLLVCASAT